MNKAFCFVTGVTGSGSTSSDWHSTLRLLAENIRSNNSDPEILVVFPGTPGVF